jgi:ergothioneine biosynthesis protein EgtB
MTHGNYGIKELDYFFKVRGQTFNLIKTLTKEDMTVQVGYDVSPMRWHLAHTTWFFEKFILEKYLDNYVPFNSSFDYLFNSYYENLGLSFPKRDRGTQSRPDVDTIIKYREYVEHQLESNQSLFSNPEIASILELGINHEQQHQELMLMDIKYNFYNNPTYPVYIKDTINNNRKATKLKFIKFNQCFAEIGHYGNSFAFDNETPRHKVWLEPFKIANRLVTNGEYLEFINANGYEEPTYWLSDGLSYIRKHSCKTPLYWKEIEGEWYVFSLNGMQTMNPEEPVSNVSYYEADAYATWKGMRLPREEEWEYAFSSMERNSNQNFMESGKFKQSIAYNSENSQSFGDLWEWTMSPYTPYPGSKPLNGSLGEYNHKFMINQMVLRGGSFATSRDHMRITYRNYFSPEKRWMFSGIRLGGDLDGN